MVLDSRRAERKWSWDGVVTLVENCFHECPGGIILASNLLLQPKAQFRVPVQLLVLQGTGESSSVDNLWVWPCNWNCNMTINPDTYIQNGFIHIRCHELTQIYKYDQGLPPRHAINRKYKYRIFSVARGSGYCDYPSSFPQTEPGALPLAQTCRYLCQNHWVWNQLWRWFVCPLRFGWLHNPLCPIFHSPDVSPLLIWCSPSGWEICRVQRLKIRIVNQYIGVFHTLCCDMQWQGLLCCI